MCQTAHHAARVGAGFEEPGCHRWSLQTPDFSSNQAFDTMLKLNNQFSQHLKLVRYGFNMIIMTIHFFYVAL